MLQPSKSLYLGTITATEPSLLPLVFLPALSGFFIEHDQTLGNHPRRALLINQPAGSGPLFPLLRTAPSVINGGEVMTKMSTIYSRLSYGTGTALTGCGVSAKAYAGAVKAEVWILADKIAGMTLSDWAIIVGIACTITTCGVNWYYRRKEREDRLNGYDTKTEE